MRLKDSMELAGRNLINMLDPEDRYLPYCDVIIYEDLSAFAELWAPQHNIGRWWDAMLRLEEATGFRIPGRIESAMMENVRAFFDNPDHLLLFPLEDDRYDREISRWLFSMHSMREGLLTLDALIRCRDSAWAREKAHGMVETVHRISREDTQPWDFDKLDRPRRVKPKPGANNSGDTMSAGRFIEALCIYYRTTSDGMALEVAERLAKVQLEYTFTPEGEINKWFMPNHAHSYLGTLRGVLLFGEITGQAIYVDAVRRTYDLVVGRLLKESGFIGHDMDKESGGDPASAADAAEIALGLARSGRPEYLDDVARIIRSRLLPCQITACPPLHRREVEVMDDGKTARYINAVSRQYRELPLKAIRFPDDLHELVVGAYGGIHGEAHGGKYSTVDVTAAVLHAMCDFYRSIATIENGRRVVRFHFDYEDDAVTIRIKRGKEARVSITCRRKEDVLVRVPGFAPAESVGLSVDGHACTPEIDGTFLRVPADLLPGEIVLTYPLPRRRTVEPTDGTDWHLTWRGDEITGIRPNARVLPFYPDAED